MTPLTAKLVAPCGRNCGICVAFFGYTMSGRRRKQPCRGCLSRITLCAFLKQHCDALATQRIHYCFECPEFPCVRLTTLDRRYRDKYGKSVIENLRHIQRLGINPTTRDQSNDSGSPNFYSTSRTNGNARPVA
jgi:hypothetical protein